MKCLSSNCSYTKHSTRGGNYCCRKCANTPNTHGRACQRIVEGIETTRLDEPKRLKRALLVGINYLENPRNRLAGCINDVKNMKAQLTTANPECKEFRILTDDSNDPLLQPTRKNIIDGINWLVKDLNPNESVFFHYSGHGGLTLDLSGDEKSGKDSCIYPIQAGEIEIITDDELRIELVNKIPTSCKAFVVLDSCHSGTALDLRYILRAPRYGEILIRQNNAYPESNGSVIFLSGCADNQTSADTVDSNNIPSGALTNSLLEVWKKYGMDIKFKHLLWDVRAVLKTNGYSQIPQMSCSNNINIDDTFRL